jgi:phosphoadenylyl-sulfate reductase (thioredoxin)
MPIAATQEDVKRLVEILNFAEKVDRSLRLIERAYDEYGERLVVANSLGKDSSAVWHLAGRVSDRIRGFIVTTRFKPAETRRFMSEELARDGGRLKVFESNAQIPDDLYKTDPDRCCEILKVEPTRRALEEMNAACWVTGLRCTEGRTRTDYQEVEERDEGLIKLNPILLWTEREVWQYLALNRVPVNPLYGAGYRSLGCEPCSHISTGHDERAGRWVGTSKCGGECGIHTRRLKTGRP